MERPPRPWRAGRPRARRPHEASDEWIGAASTARSMPAGDPPIVRRREAAQLAPDGRPPRWLLEGSPSAKSGSTTWRLVTIRAWPPAKATITPEPIAENRRAASMRSMFPARRWLAGRGRWRGDILEHRRVQFELVHFDARPDHGKHECQQHDPADDVGQAEEGCRSRPKRFPVGEGSAEFAPRPARPGRPDDARHDPEEDARRRHGEGDHGQRQDAPAWPGAEEGRQTCGAGPGRFGQRASSFELAGSDVNVRPAARLENPPRGSTFVSALHPGGSASNPHGAPRRRRCRP